MKQKTLTSADVSTIAMTTGGEKKHPIVIHGKWVKQWVGIGWINLNIATADDKKRYPTVKE